MPNRVVGHEYSRNRVACLGLVVVAGAFTPAASGAVNETCTVVAKDHVSDIETRAAIQPAGVSARAVCGSVQCKISFRVDAETIYERSSRIEAPLRVCEVRQSRRSMQPGDLCGKEV